MYVEFECAIKPTEFTKDVTPEEASYILGFANPSLSVKPVEGYTKAENILASLLVAQEIYTRAGEAEVERAECALAERGTEFPFGDDDEVEGAIVALINDDPEEFFGRALTAPDIDLWCPDLAPFAPAEPDDGGGEDEDGNPKKAWPDRWAPSGKELLDLWKNNQEAKEVILEALVEDASQSRWYTVFNKRQTNALWETYTEGREISEWWVVSHRLSQLLPDFGETVIGDLWGRESCGQSIILDGVIQKIARRLINAALDRE